MTRMKRDQPAVSLLVPVYNVEKYLSQCLETVVTQTYPHLEIILVNAWNLRVIKRWKISR